jgi:acyl-CoA synthetase (NDP forming)
MKTKSNINNLSQPIIITNAGGFGVILLDNFAEFGITPGNFDETTKEDLEKYLGNKQIHNPLDILGDASSQKYLQVTEILLQNHYQNLVIVASHQIMTDLDNLIIGLAKIQQKYLKANIFSFNPRSRTSSDSQKNSLPKQSSLFSNS